MDFLKGLFSMTGGKKTYKRRNRVKRGGACESGEACAAEFSADSSLSQGETFAKMTRAYHGGKRTRGMGRRMRGGAADLATAFEISPAEIHQRSGTAVLDQAISDLDKYIPSHAPQTGGSAELGEAFQVPDMAMAKQAGTSILNTAMEQLGKFIPAKGGKRSKNTRRARGGALGNAPIDAPAMLLRPEDYPAAFLNPQWVQENVVNPNFHGPDNALTAPSVGGARKTRKARKATRKTRKAKAKAGKKCPRGKVYRKTFNRKGRRIFGKCVRKH
jgi:hypothetical protein